MVDRHDTMMNPPVEHLLDLTGSKFRLVTVASLRARQINSYFNQLGDGLGAMVPPQVTSLARKPLSIAFEEIDAGKIVSVNRVDPDLLEEPMVPDDDSPFDGTGPDGPSFHGSSGVGSSFDGLGVGAGAETPAEAEDDEPAANLAAADLSSSESG